jgi:uncharacterized protein (TIGR03083 family)
MSPDPTSRRNPFVELRYALAEADAEAPPVGLRERVVRAVLAARPAGPRATPATRITVVEAFRRTVASFDATLSGLTPSGWGRPALRGLDVQGLVGHLIGVEQDFHITLGLSTVAPVITDHVASTQPQAVAQAGRPHTETHREWRAATHLTLEHLDGLGNADLQAPVTLHGLTLPLASLLTVRFFEMWTHEEDIRRAVGAELVAPGADRLMHMTELATALLPHGMARINRAHPGLTTRLVLTGPGGGAWSISDAPLAQPADAVIVADTVGFCRLVADRIDPTALGAVVTGHEKLAADVLAGARALALD